MQELIAHSTRLVVMTERGRQILEDVYRAPSPKIDLIPHGIPDIPFVDPNYYKDQFGVEGRVVLLTFGLLSPNKGIEHVLNALPQILAEFPDVVYVVLGATHPHELRERGEAYRLSLEILAKKNKVEKSVIFYNRFVELEELKEFIGAADLYITPYLNEAQITSGTLAYAFGAGKAVVSTPYWHAAELLAEERGILVPFGDSQAIARDVAVQPPPINPRLGPVGWSAERLGQSVRPGFLRRSLCPYCRQYQCGLSGAFQKLPARDGGNNAGLRGMVHDSTLIPRVTNGVRHRL
jgi:glycosyltransferase involved in cell wall biosynthesis